MPTPSSFSVNIEDIDGESERTADGNLHRERIGVKRKLELEYSYLNQEQSSKLLNAVQSVFFNVEYPDPQLGVITKTFYVGSRSVPTYSYVKNVPMWKNLKFNLVER